MAFYKLPKKIVAYSIYSKRDLMASYKLPKKIVAYSIYSKRDLMASYKLPKKIVAYSIYSKRDLMASYKLPKKIVAYSIYSKRDLMAQKLKPRKALRDRLLKIQNACVNQLAMPTNLELTSSRLLSLLSLTSIAGAVTTLWMLASKRTLYAQLFLKSRRHSTSRTGQNSVYGGLLQIYGNVNPTAREEAIHSKSCGLHFA